MNIPEGAKPFDLEVKPKYGIAFSYPGRALSAATENSICNIHAPHGFTFTIVTLTGKWKG